MKRIYTILVAVLITASVFAQVPEKISYQAVIRNSSDQLVKDNGIGMQVSILQGSTTGTAVYVETHNTTTNASGLVTIEIGDGTVVSGDFSTIDWSNDVYFIKTETDPTSGGGTNYTISGTSQLLSVPYALHAKTAESIVGGISETDPVYTANFDLSNISNGDLLKFNGTKFVKFTPNYLTSYIETQNLSDVISNNTSAGNANITNLADPVNAKDAANKDYVDALEAQIKSMQNSLVLAGILVKDYDGNTYPTVTIGNQVWMAEDLKVTRYPNGDAIPYIDDDATWGALANDNTSDAYSVYGDSNNDGVVDVSNPDYGYLYSYAAAIGDNWARDNTANQGVCPDGWHLPSDTEWTELETYIGNDGHSGTEGTALKATTGWNNNGNGTDDYGFSALPGGARTTGGAFIYVGDTNIWWNSKSVSTYAFTRKLLYSLAYVDSSNNDMSYGFSVRCVKD